MSERSAAIGLASASAREPPPNSSAAALGTNDQVTASRSDSAASVRLARRVRFCMSVSTGFGTPSSSRGRGAGGARSTPAMRRICSTTSALTWMSGRQEGTKHAPVFDPEAQPAQDRLAFLARDIDAEQPLHFAVLEGNRTARRRRIARDDHARRLAAADREDELGREIAAGDAEVGIDAALEAIARVGGDAELPAGLRDGRRVPERAFDQHVARRLVAAGMLAAHDSGDRLDAVRVGDRHHALVERVGLAVERQHAFAGAGAPDREIAGDLGEVEHVQRAAAVEGDVIGDVDERADRPQADRPQPLLHPFGRGAVGHAAHEPQGEGRAEMRVGGREIEMDAGRAVERAVIRLRRRRLQLAQPGRGEIARDAGDAGGVGTVRRHRDVDDGIVEPGVLRVSDADRRVVGQFDDAVVILAELELGRRAQHAVRLDAADDALGERQLLAGNIGSRPARTRSSCPCARSARRRRPAPGRRRRRRCRPSAGRRWDAAWPR